MYPAEEYDGPLQIFAHHKMRNSSLWQMCCAWDALFLSGLLVPVQAICIAACYNVEWPLLIVCPSSVTITWLEALLTWLSPKVLPERHDIHVISSSKVSEWPQAHLC